MNEEGITLHSYFFTSEFIAPGDKFRSPPLFDKRARYVYNIEKTVGVPH